MRYSYELVAGYAIAGLIRLGFKRIELIGFDGYELGDVRQKEMAELFRVIGEQYLT